MSAPSERDGGRPDRAELAAGGRDVVRRVLPVGVAWWVLVIGIGLLIVGPLRSLPAEDSVNEAFVKERSPVLNTATGIWSMIGTTEFIIGGCLLAGALLWWRTRSWRTAAAPALAVALQAVIFMTTAALVGRERPDVDHLDDSPPTSAYPSGHSGASTAFYLTLALIAYDRIRRPVLRWVVVVACLMVPVLVAFSRLYRGMHAPTDVTVGVLNGIVCAVLAWRWMLRGRRDDPERPTSVPHGEHADPVPG